MNNNYSYFNDKGSFMYLTSNLPFLIISLSCLFILSGCGEVGDSLKATKKMSRQMDLMLVKMDETKNDTNSNMKQMLKEMVATKDETNANMQITNTNLRTTITKFDQSLDGINTTNGKLDKMLESVDKTGKLTEKLSEITGTHMPEMNQKMEKLNNDLEETKNELRVKSAKAEMSDINNCQFLEPAIKLFSPANEFATYATDTQIIRFIELNLSLLEEADSESLEGTDYLVIKGCTLVKMVLVSGFLSRERTEKIINEHIIDKNGVTLIDSNQNPIFFMLKARLIYFDKFLEKYLSKKDISKKDKNEDVSESMQNINSLEEINKLKIAVQEIEFLLSQPFKTHLQSFETKTLSRWVNVWAHIIPFKVNKNQKFKDFNNYKTSTWWGKIESQAKGFQDSLDQLAPVTLNSQQLKKLNDLIKEIDELKKSALENESKKIILKKDEVSDPFLNSTSIYN